ncbi:MAG: carboxypeptidase-like regulatory domain-containing protein [Bryobacteraceae bacterium]
MNRIRPLALILASLIAHAQSLSTGQVQGLVVDSTGSPVPSAEISLRSEQTGASRTARTTEAGQFRIPAVPIGEYSLRAEAQGFAPYKIDSLLVSVGQTVAQRIELTPATVVEKLEVKAEADAIQTTATTGDVALGYDRIEETPSQNRNYLSFVFAAPGMASSAGSNTQRSAAGTRNVANDSGFVFAGMRGRNNGMSIDGVDNRDEFNGGNRVAIGLEMVQEFRVSGTSVAAEYGGAAGGQVNVVTRSGVNILHGDATMFFQNEAINARNPELTVPRKQRSRRRQPGTSINGPIRKDRTFYATAIESSWEDSEEWSETPRALLALIERRTGQRGVAGLFPSKGHDTEFSFKFNHAITSRHALTSRYAFSQGRVGNDVNGVDNFSDWTNRGSSFLRDHSFVASVVSLLSNSLVNDLRVQVARRSGTIWPNAPGPMHEVPGVITVGGAYRLDQQRTEDHREFVDSFSATHGSHLITAGASVHSVALDARVANRFGGVFVYPSLADFAAGRWDVHSQAFGDPRTNFSTVPVGLWLQDKWQARHGLTVEAGLRFDRQSMPAVLPHSSSNVAPRFGLAWHPGSKSSWVFRAGTGLFYDRYALAFLNDAVQKDGVRAWETYSVGGVESTVRSAYRAADHFPSTYSIKWSAGFERKLDKDTTVSGEANIVQGKNLSRIRNYTGLLPPQYLLEQTAKSSYRGGTVTVNRRLAKEWTYLASYTAGRARDDASDFDEHPLDPLNLRRDWARSRQHQLHRIAASALFELPTDDYGLDGLTFAPMYTWGSGRPLNQLALTDVLRTGAYPISARPAGVGRNTFFGPSIGSFDLRVFKQIKVREGRAVLYAGAESFNLLNRTNAVRVNPYTGANFRQGIEIGNARQVQLFLAFEY